MTKKCPKCGRGVLSQITYDTYSFRDGDIIKIDINFKFLDKKGAASMDVDSDTGDAVIETMEVHPKRAGLGKALYEKIEAELIRNNATVVSLYAQSLEASRFWKAMGYKAQDPTAIKEYGEGWMEKDLYGKY